MLREQLSRFNSIMQGIERFYEDYAKSVGLTYMSLTVLEILYHAKSPITQKEISAESHYNKQVVNTIVKNFYESGYVSFEEASEDRRNKYVLFTETGKEYADRIMIPLGKKEDKAILVLTEDERERMLAMLERCYEGFVKQAEMIDQERMV